MHVGKRQDGQKQTPVVHRTHSTTQKKRYEMPSVKSSIRSLAQATSKATFVNVPRLETPPRYDRWLRRLLVTPQNKKTVETCQKADVDHLFREQASQQFKDESELLKRAFAEVQSCQTMYGIVNTADIRGRYPRGPVKTHGSLLCLIAVSRCLRVWPKR